VKQVMYQALISSAVGSAELAQSMGMQASQIIISCKVSGVQDLIAVYRELGRTTRYPLHLGLTEAGMGTKGTVASSAALAVLLQEGIGDTIRVSLTPAPGESRNQEVVVAAEILQALGLQQGARHRGLRAPPFLGHGAELATQVTVDAGGGLSARHLAPPHWLPHQCLKPGVARAAQPRAAGWIRQIALSPDQPRP
jgi:hypothetical protein